MATVAGQRGEEEQRKVVRLHPEEERLLAKVLTHKLVEGARGGEVRPRQDHLDALGNSTLAGRVAQPLLGGLAVKRLGLKVRGLLKMTSVTQFIAILTALGLVARCPPIETIGPQRNISSLGPGLECNCDCDKFDYSPVCSDSGDALLQFYNPCYAGCQDKQLEPGSGLLYLNCSCIPVPVSLPLPATDSVIFSDESSARPGKCDSDCVFLPVFLISFFLTMCITFLANMPTLTATLRCVDPSVKLHPVLQ